MKPTKEMYLRAADYMERVGNNHSDTSWGQEGGPCCMGGAVIYGQGQKIPYDDRSEVLTPLMAFSIRGMLSYHEFSKNNPTATVAAKLREIAETLPSEVRTKTTDISILKDIAAAVSAGKVSEIVGR